MLKRIIDIILSVVVLSISIPFLIIILLVVYFLTKKFPLITQNRKLTLDKINIKIWKIRTIKETDIFKTIESSTNNIFYKPEYEKYVPGFCKWLRQSGIDEIPQLINVIKGELSLIGPRPMIEKDLLIMKKNEPEIYRMRTMLNSKPGITGCWQLYGKRERGSKNLLALDTFYERKKSFFFDMEIIIKTFFVMLRAKHSDSIVAVNFGKMNKRSNSKIPEFSQQREQS